MTSIKKEQVLEEYCSNEMKKLKEICYPKILKIGGISQMDYDDLYSIALEVIHHSVENYEETKNCKFSTYLNSNINKKFTSYIRDKNAIKRSGEKKKDESGERIYKHNVSIDAIKEDGIDLCEKIPSDFNIEDKLLEETGFSLENNIHNFSPAMQEYLHNLSRVQLKVLELMYQGYNQEEIQDILHITKELYRDSIVAITSKKATRKIKKSLRGYKNVR